MSDRLPPLTALRAFEAAARHLSFAEAAKELHVTPAALSFQIKSLEEHLGQPVFRRFNRAVELTAAGRALAPGCSEGFTRLAEAWRAAQRLQEARVLTVTAGPAFTAQWLSPRLFDFARRHPEVELHFAASLRLMDFGREEVDLAIRYGHDVPPGLWWEELLPDWFAPFMAPDLAARYPTPESLTKAPLIFEDSAAFLDPPADWAAWFRACGIGHAPEPTARFSQADHGIHAALGGEGAVFTRISLALPALAQGLLVAPYGIALGVRAGYRVICAPESMDRHGIRVFRDWLSGNIQEALRYLPEKRIIPVESLSR